MLNAYCLHLVGAIAPALALTMPTSAAIASPIVPDVVNHLPDNTAYVILLDMREETWQQLDQYALVQQLQAQAEFPLNAGGLPFLPSELDYQAEIAPWIGDTTALALMPLARPRFTVLAEHEVLIAPIADAAKFEGFVDTIAALRGIDPEMQPFQTLDILYWEPLFFEDLDEPVEPIPAPDRPTESSTDVELNAILPEADRLKVIPESDPDVSLPEQSEPDVPGLAIAVFPDFLIAAEHPAAIRAWASLRPENTIASLANNERFLRTLAHPHYEAALSVAYGSLSEMVKYAQADFGLPELPFEVPIPAGITPEEIAQLASLQLDSSIEALIYPTNRGIRIQGRGYYDNTILQAIPATTEPAPTDVLDHLPGDSFGTLSGHNLAAAWQGVAATLEASEETSALLEQARGFFTAFTGLDLDQDLFGWMDRGFSVFLFPTEQTPLTLFSPDLHIGLGIALQTSDRAKAETTFAALDENLGAGLITVESAAVNGSTITGWGPYAADGAPESFLGRGWASDDTIILTSSLGSLSDLLNLERDQVLSNAFRFSQSTQDFPANNQGYLYANTGPMRSLFARFFPPNPDDVASQEFRKLIASIQAFSGTLSFQEEYLQLDGLVMLAPAEGRSRSSQ